MPAKLNLSPEEMQERRRARWRRARDRWNIERNPMLYGPHLPRKERKALKDRERYAKNRETYLEKARETQKVRYHRLKNDPEFKARVRANARRTHAKNPERALAQTRLYQTRKRNAAPPWLTKTMKDQMLSFYREARMLTKQTGEAHHVDHIEPLNGKDACGLHVPWNLQVLLGKKNLSKGNRREGSDG